MKYFYQHYELFGLAFTLIFSIVLSFLVIPFIGKLINKKRRPISKKFLDYYQFEEFLENSLGDIKTKDFISDLENIKNRFDQFTVRQLRLLESSLVSFEYDFSKNFTIQIMVSFVILIYVGDGSHININSVLLASSLIFPLLVSYHKKNFKIKQLKEIISLCINDKQEIEKNILKKE